jgi:tetratricopeptide (TPR) repeat protein
MAKARNTRIELQPESVSEAYLRLPPLCGREKELDAVRSALVGLDGGGGGHLLLEGPKGIGRTRFLREVYFEAQLSGYATVFGNGADPDLVKKLGAELALQLSTERPVEQHSKDSQAGEADDSPEEHIARIIGIAEETPVVLCIDDMQETLKPVQSAIDRLVRITGTSDAPSLLLVTARQDTEGEEPVTTPDTVRLRLHTLALEEVRDVVSRMFGRIPAPELFVSHLMNATGGVPHAIVEMIRMLVASGEIAVMERKWRFRGGIEPFEIPPSLEEFYSNQVKALSRPLSNIALNLALLDRYASMKEVSAFHREPAKRIADTLGELEKRVIIHRANGRVGIANEGLRDALIASRSRSTLKRRHRHIAEKLSGIRSRKISKLEIARHFLLSGERKKGLRYGLSGIEAGEVEKDRDAAVAVLGLFWKTSKKALPVDRAKILFAHVGVMIGRHESGKVLDVIKEYFSIVPRKEPPERRARMHRRAASCYERLNQHENAYAAWKKALSLVDVGSPDYYGTLTDYTTALEYRGQFSECEKLLLDAIEQSGEEKESGIIGLLIRLAYLALRRQKLELVSEYIDRTKKLAGEMGEDETPRVLMLIAAGHFVTDNFKEAESYLKRARKIVLEQKQPLTISRITNNLALVAFNLEKVDEALQYAAEVETIKRRYGDFQGLSNLYLILGTEMSGRIGNTSALEYLHKGLECARAGGTTMMEYHILDRIAATSFSRGDLNGAIKYSDEAEQLSKSGKMERLVHPDITRAMAFSYAGDTKAGFESAEKGLKLALAGKGVELIVGARRTVCRVALLAGNFRVALEQLGDLEDLVEKANLEQRFSTLVFLADFWLQVGQVERALVIMERISREPRISEISYSRAPVSLIAGKIATARSRFEEADKAFSTANHLLSMDKDAVAFADLRRAEVVLELSRGDTNAAKARHDQMSNDLAALPDESVYFRLVMKSQVAGIALREGDKDRAYKEVMECMDEARDAGYRLLELELSKTVVAASSNPEEVVRFKEKVRILSGEMAEPFEKSIRAAVQEHLLK